MSDFSYILITHNRRRRLLKTLEYLFDHTAAARHRWQVWVVDNASTDGTAQAVTGRFGKRVHLVRLERNIGMPARNLAIERSEGRYVVLLDDDSYPLDDAVDRCLDYLAAQPRTAAVSGRVLLPDGRAEAPALPGVFIGCAAVLRRSALEQVGLFDPVFFRQAEEYDLSFRLVSAGWRIERFEDVCFAHDKQMTGRPGGLAVAMDLRNNLLLCRRYLPAPARRAYRQDWCQRYAALARHAGQVEAAGQGLRDYRRLRADQPSRPMNLAAFEALFDWRCQAQQVARWAGRYGLKRVLIGDLGKNLYATWRACRLAGLEVLAIAERPGPFVGLRYRGVRVIDQQAAACLGAEGLVLSNVNPACVEQRARQLQGLVNGPVLRLWRGRVLGPGGRPQAGPRDLGQVA